MPIASSTQPSLRVRVLPRFPANVIAGTGITITRSGHTYIFSTAAVADLPLSALADLSANRLVGRDAGAGPPEQLTVSGGLEFTGAGGLQLTAGNRTRQVPIVLFNNGSVLTTGIKADWMVPFACNIRQWTLLADQSGSIVVDIWKDTYANYPPTAADTITAAAKPTLASVVKNQSSTLTGWTTAINIGDILRFNIDSVATVNRVTLLLDLETL